MLARIQWAFTLYSFVTPLALNRRVGLAIATLLWITKTILKKTWLEGTENQHRLVRAEVIKRRTAQEASVEA
jgi:hypothetical protein